MCIFVFYLFICIFFLLLLTASWNRPKLEYNTLISLSVIGATKKNVNLFHWHANMRNTHIMEKLTDTWYNHTSIVCCVIWIIRGANDSKRVEAKMTWSFFHEPKYTIINCCSVVKCILLLVENLLRHRNSRTIIWLHRKVLFCIILS